MKTALTRLATATVIALVFLTSACTGPSPTDPSDVEAPTRTGLADPPDEVIKR